jgi:hypothetical protein
MKKYRAGRWLAAAACAATCGTAHADWEFIPEIALGGTYTDNVELAPEGLEENEFVTEIRPSFTLSSDGPRFQAEMAYQLQHFMFSEDSDRNETFHNFAATTRSELAPERFFLDLNGAYGQALIDPERAIPVSNVLVSQNLTDYWSVDANPYFQQDIGRARLRLDYSYGVVRYPDFDISAGNNVDSFDREARQIRLGSLPNEPGLTWEADYRQQIADYEDFDEYKYDIATLRVGVPLGRQFQIVGRYGFETDVQEDPRGGGLDIELWEAGFRWQVSPRNEVEARVGDRFFGQSYFFSWTMEGSRLQSNVTYNETPTTFSLEQLNPNRVLVQNGPNPVYDIVALSPDLYINKEGTADLTWTLARSEILLRARSVQREFITIPGEEREAGAGLGWYWRFGPRTQLNVSLYGAEVEFRDTDVTDEISQATLGLSRLVGQRTTVDLTFRYDQRRSTSVQQANEYTERAVMLMITRSFGREGVAFGGRANLPGLRT